MFDKDFEISEQQLARLMAMCVVVGLISTTFIGGVAAQESLGEQICSSGGGVNENLGAIEDIIAAGLNFLVTAGALMAALLAIVGALTDQDIAIPKIGDVSDWYEPIVGYITFLIIIVAVEIGFNIVFGIDISCITPSIPGTGS